GGAGRRAGLRVRGPPGARRGGCRHAGNPPYSACAAGAAPWLIRRGGCRAASPVPVPGPAACPACTGGPGTTAHRLPGPVPVLDGGAPCATPAGGRPLADAEALSRRLDRPAVADP